MKDGQAWSSIATGSPTADPTFAATMTPALVRAITHVGAFHRAWSSASSMPASPATSSGLVDDPAVGQV
jgi:hypothetical protein